MCSLLTCNTAAWPQERSLLQQAVKVADVSNWHSRGETFYRWLSNHELMFVRPEWTFFRLNLVTGVERPLQAFNQAYQQSDNMASVPGMNSVDGMPSGMDFLEISQDSKAILWSIGRSYAFTTDLQSSLFKPLNYPSDQLLNRILWLEGRDEWAELVMDKPVHLSQVALHYQDNPFHWKTRTFTVRKGLLPNFYFIFDSRVCSVKDGILVRLLSVGGETSVNYSEILLTSRTQTFNQHTIPLPTGKQWGAGTAIVFSPRQDLIAWMLESPGEASKRRAGVWVSHRDGDGMHEIGSIVLDSRTTEQDRLHDMQWLLDGKRLSFVYKDALYTVLVN